MSRNIFISFIKPKTWLVRFVIAFGIISVLVLAEFGYLDHAIVILKSQQLTFKVGDISFNLFRIVKTLILILFLFWLVSIILAVIEKQLSMLSKMNPSNLNLISKAVHIALYGLICLIVLNSMGIDLTALTIFSGALGIGIGFGLQKVASNFISGLILLFEKSIEQGDLIELNDGIYGYIRKTNARYSLIETLEGREVFVPNEDFITSRVTNWTYSSNIGRITVNVGVSYDSDLKLVQQLILEAASENPLCSKTNKPECFIEGYAESSVNFILFFWVDNILQGRLLPKSQVLFAIWDKFKEHHIKIPFPQRDLHIKKGINHLGLSAEDGNKLGAIRDGIKKNH